MSTIMPPGEAARKAVTWISEKLGEPGHAALEKLIEEAAVRFDLGPKDVEFLQRFLKEQGGEDAG